MTSQPVQAPRRKLVFIGDPHGDFSVAIREVEKHAPCAIILLGDLQARRPLHIELAPIIDRTEVWFIHGNHDSDSEADYDNLFGSELAHRNLHGRVVDICGVRVAGLGGIFRESIWAPPAAARFHARGDLLESATMSDLWRGGISLRHQSSIFAEDVELLSRQHADVLVSHEAPGGHRHGWKAIDGLAVEMGVQAIVHGHHHEQVDYAAEGRLSEGCRYLAYGVSPENALVRTGSNWQFDRAAR